MGCGINSVSQSADDAGSDRSLSHRLDQTSAPFPTVRAEVPGPDYRDGRMQVKHAGGRGSCIVIQAQGRIRAFGEEVRIVVFAVSDEAETAVPDALQFPGGPVQLCAGELAGEFPMRSQGDGQILFRLPEDGRRGTEGGDKGVPRGGYESEYLVQGTEGEGFISHAFLPAR